MLVLLLKPEGLFGAQAGQAGMTGRDGRHRPSRRIALALWWPLALVTLPWWPATSTSCTSPR